MPRLSLLYTSRKLPLLVRQLHHTAPHDRCTYLHKIQKRTVNYTQNVVENKRHIYTYH